MSDTSKHPHDFSPPRLEDVLRWVLALPPTQRLDALGRAQTWVDSVFFGWRAGSYRVHRAEWRALGEQLYGVMLGICCGINWVYR